MQPHDNPYWKALVDRFPLTLHALVADDLMGENSYARIESRPSPQVAQYVGQTWDRYNVSSFVISLFLARKETVAAERFSRYVAERLEPDSFETGLFWGLAHLASGNTRNSIRTSFNAVRDHGGGKLNNEVLQLLYPLKYHKEVLALSKNVEPALMLALMRQESSFNPKAKSPVGARGLMQIMPQTAKHITRKRNINLHDPVQNITVGTLYLSKLLAAHEDNFVFTLASYNAGPRAVERWRARYDVNVGMLFADLVPYPETRNYVSGLLRNMHWYRLLLNNVVHANPSGVAWTPKTLIPRLEPFGVKPGEPAPEMAFEKPKF